jgi:hypothetical protein
LLIGFGGPAMAVDNPNGARADQDVVELPEVLLSEPVNDSILRPVWVPRPGSDQEALADTLETKPSIGSLEGGGGPTTSLSVRGQGAGQTALLLNGVPLTDPSTAESSADIQGWEAGHVTRLRLEWGAPTRLHSLQGLHVLLAESEPSATNPQTRAGLLAGARRRGVMVTFDQPGGLSSRGYFSRVSSLASSLASPWRGNSESDRYVGRSGLLVARSRWSGWESTTTLLARDSEADLDSGFPIYQDDAFYQARTSGFGLSQSVQKTSRDGGLWRVDLAFARWQRTYRDLDDLTRAVTVDDAFAGRHATARVHWRRGEWEAALLALGEEAESNFAVAAESRSQVAATVRWSRQWADRLRSEATLSRSLRGPDAGAAGLDLIYPISPVSHWLAAQHFLRSPPSLFQTYFGGERVELKPQSATLSYVGFSRRFSSITTAVGGFSSRARDVIEFSAAKQRYANETGGRFRGIEAEVVGGRGRWNWRVSAATLEALRDDGEPWSRRPIWRGRMEVERSLNDRLRAGFNVRGVGRRYDQGEMLASYAILSGHLTWSPTPASQLALTLDNIGRARYEPILFFAGTEPSANLSWIQTF